MIASIMIDEGCRYRIRTGTLTFTITVTSTVTVDLFRNTPQRILTSSTVAN
jgi:hypothetical protein